MRGQVAESRRFPIGGGDDGQNAGHGFRRASVDGVDLGVRVRRPQHDTVGHAGKLDVVGIVPGATHQARVLEARHALADCKFTHATVLIISMIAMGRGQVCFGQFFRDAWREIREHAVGARALEGNQAFDHRAFAVKPAVLRRRLDHRVLAGHLIGEGRHAECLFHARDDVEIGQARLDHDHVGAFLDVERHFAQRLVGIAGVHLIGALVAGECLCRADCVAEWTVKGGGIFRCI